ncbi:hypothetical protein BCV70DRAFT_198330 [Testicularia cyperi]|uniref:Uncharacterized protein n=1 Tax=Testicularia cyperi TaxID=1882483 RepID=A0A317XXL0_9BASI|nr:hypothetical protein BCV70DRAFT_198330 [Testicularia cyperi]
MFRVSTTFVLSAMLLGSVVLPAFVAADGSYGQTSPHYQPGGNPQYSNGNNGPYSNGNTAGNGNGSPSNQGSDDPLAEFQPYLKYAQDAYLANNLPVPYLSTRGNFNMDRAYMQDQLAGTGSCADGYGEKCPTGAICQVNTDPGCQQLSQQDMLDTERTLTGSLFFMQSIATTAGICQPGSQGCSDNGYCYFDAASGQPNPNCQLAPAKLRGTVARGLFYLAYMQEQQTQNPKASTQYTDDQFNIIGDKVASVLTLMGKCKDKSGEYCSQDGYCMLGRDSCTPFSEEEAQQIVSAAINSVKQGSQLGACNAGQNCPPDGLCELRGGQGCTVPSPLTQMFIIQQVFTESLASIEPDIDAAYSNGQYANTVASKGGNGSGDGNGGAGNGSGSGSGYGGAGGAGYGGAAGGSGSGRGVSKRSLPKRLA